MNLVQSFWLLNHNSIWMLKCKWPTNLKLQLEPGPFWTSPTLDLISEIFTQQRPSLTKSTVFVFHIFFLLLILFVKIRWKYIWRWNYFSHFCLVWVKVWDVAGDLFTVKTTESNDSNFPFLNFQFKIIHLTEKISVVLSVTIDDGSVGRPNWTVSSRKKEVDWPWIRA